MLESIYNLLQNPYNVTQLTLGTLIHYLGKVEIQIFADIQQIWKKMQTSCILSAPILIRQRMYLCMLSVFMCFYQQLVLVAEYHVDCWHISVTMQWRLTWRIFGTTNCKQVKEQCHEKFYLQWVRRKTRYVKHRKYQNLWTNNKVEGG